MARAIVNILEFNPVAWDNEKHIALTHNKVVIACEAIMEASDHLNEEEYLQLCKYLKIICGIHKQNG